MLELIDHAPDGIREIRLARPPVNALNTELLRRLTAEFTRGAEASALVVSGAPGLFSAGLDVRSMLALDRNGVCDVFVEVWRVQRALAVSPVPVVFAIMGHCPAGGTVLAIHADYRVMAQGDFRLGLNETQVGLVPGPPIDIGETCVPTSFFRKRTTSSRESIVSSLPSRRASPKEAARRISVIDR